MAYRDAVKYIEDMKPGYVNAVGEDCLRAKETIRAALPTLGGLPGQAVWTSGFGTADLYEQRLREAIDLVEGLYDGFDKAGIAVTTYAQAQARAKALVTDGIGAEDRLGALIAPIVAANPAFQVPPLDALRQWEQLRGATGAPDYLIGPEVAEGIERVRVEADALWGAGTLAYDDAIRTETGARNVAIDQLVAAYRLVPDFQANSPVAAKIIAATPGLVDPGGTHHLGPPAPPELDVDNDFPYDPNGTPTLGDYASRVKWEAMLRAGQLARPELDDATAAYSHYLLGAGADLRVDYEEAYMEDTQIRTVVDNQISEAQREAERIYRETGQTAFQMTGDPLKVGDPIESPTTYPSTENWQKTLGGHTVYGTSEVVIDGNQATMTIKVHAEDVYNFNRDAADVATLLPDNDNGRFSELGWAAGYNVHGELERTVTWTIGETPVVDEPTTGPERNASGEDRAVGGGVRTSLRAGN